MTWLFNYVITITLSTVALQFISKSSNAIAALTIIIHIVQPSKYRLYQFSLI